MKYFTLLFALICTGMIVKAQQSKPVYTYRQKQLADSLALLFPDLRDHQDTANPGFTTPVLPLLNEGSIAGVTEKGTIYKMKPDNMPRLQPNKTNSSMPNAMNGTVFMVPPADEKP